MVIPIVAFDLKQLIGANGDLVWKLKEDMAHFKRKTTGNICVMGRVTWESIPESVRPLAGRKNIVITGNADYEVPDGVLLAKNLDEALVMASDSELMTEYSGKDLYICGGQQLYEAAMPYADALEVTEIAKVYPTEGLTDLKYFPEIDPTKWYAAHYESHKTDEGLIYDFIRYEKI